MFAVGDVVVCVDDAPRTFGRVLGMARGLKNGRLYRVLGIGVCSISGTPKLYLSGIARHTGAAADRFRPLRKASADFTVLLRQPVPVGEDA